MSDVPYPRDFSQWMALLTAVAPLFALAGSAFAFAVASIWKARSERRQRNESDWKRFQSLVSILANKDKNYLLWDQVTAVREMETLKITRSAARSIGKNAQEFWSLKNEILSDETERLTRVCHPVCVIRWYWKIRLR